MSGPRLTDLIHKHLGRLQPVRQWLHDHFVAVRSSDWVFPLKAAQFRIVAAFALLILIGSVLLSMPFANKAGRVGPLEALFTATSAVCVTGLIVVDTGSDFTLAGQLIILALIQVGGLGIMTLGALAFRLLGRRMSLKSQAVLHDTLFQEDASEAFRTMFMRVLRLTAAIELVGVLCLFVLLLPGRSWSQALYSAVFHSISAFCNAGFSIYHDSLMRFEQQELVLVVVMTLIVLGGLGHTVLYELWAYLVRRVRRRPKKHVRSFSLHARLVFLVSVVLVLVGMIGLLALGLTPEDRSPVQRCFGALFQSITARTAGFNTVDIGRMYMAPLFLLVVLMFIGGSPASCAGGVKTTTFAIGLAGLRATLVGRREVRLLDRRIPVERVQRVVLLLSLAIGWNILGVLILLATEGNGAAVGMHDVVFEQFSAFGTVGLSTGLTPSLSTAGRLWVIVTMFVGRLGPLTLAMWIFRQEDIAVRYPEGKVMIG